MFSLFKFKCIIAFLRSQISWDKSSIANCSAYISSQRTQMVKMLLCCHPVVNWLTYIKYCWPTGWHMIHWDFFQRFVYSWHVNKTVHPFTRVRVKMSYRLTLSDPINQKLKAQCVCWSNSLSFKVHSCLL